MFVLPKDGKDNSVYSYMAWSTITNKSSNQYRLREGYRKTNNNLFDSNGLADIFSRKVIACTDKYGNIGDEIEVTFQKPVYYWNNKGTLFAIIGDIKSRNDSNWDEWGHLYTEGKQRSVVEFIVIGKVFQEGKTIKTTFSDLVKNPVVQIQRTGVNFFSKIPQ